MKKKVIKHLKDDIKTFKEEASEDRKLIKSLSKNKKMKKCPYAHMEEKEHKKMKHAPKKAKKHIKKVLKKTKKHVTKAVSKGEKKIKRVMREYKKGELHSGSKKGPVVKKKDQAIAIALSEAGKRKK